MKRLLFLILLLPCLVYGQTVGIKVASPIIKNSQSDNTVTGYANLLNGGYHTVSSLSGRDSLVTSFNKTLNTGMLVYVNDVDSTYRWNGTDWTAILSGGITPEILSDSLSNYTPLQDGLISGGNATIGTGSVTIDTAYYRINKTNYTSLPRTFTGIANSASGTQYYILVYGKNDDTLDTLQGVQDTIATIPTPISGTVSINTVLVGDGGVENALPDLSGYAKLVGGNNFTGTQSADKLALNYALYWKAGRQGNSNQYLYRIEPYISSSNNLFFTRTTGLYPNDLEWNYTTGVFDFKQTPTINGIPIGSGTGTVSSITPAFGFTSTTPITTTGTLTIDSTQVRTVANSYSLASGQPRLVSGTNIKTINSTSLLGSGDIALEVPLTFGYGTTRTSNTITADTTSGAGLVSKTRLTGSLASKQGLDATLTALASYNTNGILTQTGADTFTGRTLTGTTNQVIITNGSGVSGNPTFSLPQDINTTSTPQFARIGVGSASSSSSALLLPAGTTSISSLRLPNGVAPTSPVAGDIWGLTTGVRLQRYDGTNTKDFIFDKTNSVFSGLGNTAIVGDNSGNLSAVPLVNYLTDNNLSKTANYTITLTDFGANGQCTVFVDATSGAVTITLPSASTMTGLTVNVIKTDSGVNTVTVSGGATNINSATTSVLATQFLPVRIKSNGTQFYIF